ncbi:MAG: hypothetical protein VZQ80_07030 [Lachnospiraceae bacterium]|nr:hypothetical protein [Lachnospiraceae bacterium]
MKERAGNFRSAIGETAAFASVGRGTGATFMAVCCANYFASVRGRRVALAEVSGRNELSFAANDDIVVNGQVCGFSYLDVDYFPGLSPEDLPALDDMAYDLIVTDCGEARPGLADLRADTLYFAASTVPWRREQLADLFEGPLSISCDVRREKILLLTPEERARKKLSAELRMPVIGVPFIDNPCRLSQADIEDLEGVFAPGRKGRRRWFTGIL